MPRAFSKASALRQLALHHRAEGDVLEVGLPRKQRAVLEHDDAVGPGSAFGLPAPHSSFAVEVDRARR